MDSNTWYLKKHDDGVVHGPATIDQLRDWSLTAKVSPLDRVSNDEKKTWRRAPLIPELHMDWLVEVNTDYLYGPTTFGAVQEFIAAGEIDGATVVINCKEGTKARIREMPVFNNSPRRKPTSTQVLLEQEQEEEQAEINRKKILKLERVILELRLALNDAEMRYHKLAERYEAETGNKP